MTTHKSSKSQHEEFPSHNNMSSTYHEKVNYAKNPFSTYQHDQYHFIKAKTYQILK